MKSIALAIPILNEVEGLRVIMPRIDRSLFHEILVIDGGSTDGSIEYLKTMEGIKIIKQDNDGYLPGAILQALRTVATDCMIEFSPDNNCIPEDLPKICKKLNEGYDLVVCSRYSHHAKSEDDDMVSSIGNFGFSLLTRHLGKNKITDALNIYRGYDVNKVRSIPKKYIRFGSVFEPLVSAWGNVMGWSYCEIPSAEPKRIGGEAKVRYFRDGLSILIMLLRLYFFKYLSKHV